MIKAVNIIGAGNVGTFIAQKLVNRVKIKNVFSSQLENATHLANAVNAKAVNLIDELSKEVDLNIVCIKDDAIESVLVTLPKNIAIVHTSGTIDISVLKDFANHGIIYPLQSFTKNFDYRLADIPFLIEGNSAEFTSRIMSFCQTYFSKNCSELDSESRAKIHLAAVIANNFSTYLLLKSKELLDASQIDFNLLKPLMMHTIEKSFMMGPEKALTGPARRKDLRVIEKQISAIKDDELKKVYQLLTDQIVKQFNL